MSRTDENMISIYERKSLRFIFGGIQENEKWRRLNFELYRSYKESDIVNFIKIQRIKWAGHVVRMDENRTNKKVFNTQQIGTRRKEGEEEIEREREYRRRDGRYREERGNRGRRGYTEEKDREERQ
ncbi:uncharacterized protein TNCV_2696381 [Trichonephila clavipes]|nr:uncharacterized protein TNCV_2696381 [Trichonephila clavipes]